MTINRKQLLRYSGAAADVALGALVRGLLGSDPAGEGHLRPTEGWAVPTNRSLCDRLRAQRPEDATVRAEIGTDAGESDYDIARGGSFVNTIFVDSRRL